MENLNSKPNSTFTHGPSIQRLQFEGLSFCYEGHEFLFENVDFDFPLDQIVWVKASSGAGRSTLLQLLAGLQLPHQGKYLINEKDVSEMTFEEFLPFRLNIGYGFDYGGLINNRTLFENLMLPLEYHKILSIPEAKERVSQQFEIYQLEKYMNLRPAFVPGRVRKLLCLIRALILEPQVLLLDDPSVGLNESEILRFFDQIQKLRSENKVRHVFVSSFDEKLMSLFDHSEIYVDTHSIYKEPPNMDKKVVHL